MDCEANLYNLKRHHPLFQLHKAGLKWQIVALSSTNGNLTVSVDEVGQEQVQLSDGDIYMIGINTETRMKTIRRLL